MRLRNIFIIFLITLIGLVFTTCQVFAEPVGDCEELENRYNSLEEKNNSLDDDRAKCESNLLSSEERIDCFSNAEIEKKKLQKEIGEIMNQLEGCLGKVVERERNLKNSINYLRVKIENTGLEINATEQEINLINLNISSAEEEIKKTEEEIKNTEDKISETKEKLADSIRTLYEYDSQNLVRLTLSKGALSDFFDELVYIENLQKQMTESLDKLKENKKILENKKIEIAGQKGDLEKKREEVAAKIGSLNEIISHNDGLKRETEIVLEITQGNEELYKNLSAKLEEQKKQILGDLSILSQQKAAEIAKLSQIYGRPSGLDSELSWYYNQRNYKDTIIPLCYNKDGSSCDLGQYGCAITSVAMVFTKYGSAINPPELTEKSAFAQGGLLYWPQQWNNITLYKNTYHSGVNWQEIDQEIDQNQPVIVFIRAKPSGAGHYIVIHHKFLLPTGEQKYVVHDPYFGANIYLDESLASLGVLYYNDPNALSISNIDQMIIYHP